MTNVVKWDHYSSWNTLLRHTAWIIKLKNNWISWKRGNKASENFNVLHVSEIKEAETVLLKLSQIEAFTNDYLQLQLCQSLTPKSKLIPLQTIFDERIIRVGGRISQVHLPYEVKHQVIISPKQPIARLIITDIHERNFHAGRNATLALVRERFWIIRFMIYHIYHIKYS